MSEFVTQANEYEKKAVRFNEVVELVRERCGDTLPIPVLDENVLICLNALLTELKEAREKIAQLQIAADGFDSVNMQLREFIPEYNSDSFTLSVLKSALTELRDRRESERLMPETAKESESEQIPYCRYCDARLEVKGGWIAACPCWIGRMMSMDEGIVYRIESEPAKGETFRVRITQKPSQPGYFYNFRVGEEFNVVNATEMEYSVAKGEDRQNHYILKSDCEILASKHFESQPQTDKIENGSSSIESAT